MSSTLPKPNPKPGFFQKTQPKPNPNLTRNFKTQTQPKTEFENLTQPKKNRVYFGLFFKENFFQILAKFSRKFHKKKIFFGLIFLSKILFKLSLQHGAAWSNHGRPLKILILKILTFIYGVVDHGFPYSTKSFGYRMPVLGPA